VLEHLVGNAVKFTAAGEVRLEVRRHAAQVAGAAAETVCLIFSVRDTGIGIAPEDRTRIFERFAQVDGSATRRFGGTGLGLAIASRLVEKMGGTIRVDSTPGQGSTFSFALHFGLVEDPESDAGEDARPDAGAPAA
jgi:signal transduction histidine kinase